MFNNAHFLTKEYFALQMTETLSIVYRVFDGSEICRINPAQLMFVTKSTGSRYFSPKITGILHLPSRTIFKPSLKSLLSLGAQNICIGRQNRIWKQEVELPEARNETFLQYDKFERKLEILSVHCPGIFFDNLLSFSKENVNQKLKRMNEKSLKYTVFEKKTGTYDSVMIFMMNQEKEILDLFLSS
jgi:hypothetical protein